MTLISNLSTQLSLYITSFCIYKALYGVERWDFNQEFLPGDASFMHKCMAQKFLCRFLPHFIIEWYPFWSRIYILWYLCIHKLLLNVHVRDWISFVIIMGFPWQFLQLFSIDSAVFPYKDPAISSPCSFYGQNICSVGNFWVTWS